jgi:hypothetical protein
VSSNDVSGDGDEKVAQHLRLPAWLVEALNARAREQNRSISHQLTHELERLPHFAKVKPRPKDEAEIDPKARPKAVKK